MDKTNLTAGGRACTLYSCDKPEYLLIQPADDHDIEVLDNEVWHIETLTDAAFSLAVFKVKHWNNDLSPWVAPPVFGNEPFGGGAPDTLTFIERELIPSVGVGEDVPVIIGGYSLAGLFALWAAYTSNRFAGVAGVSPSVWFSDWLNFVSERTPAARCIYLSLGKKEEKTRNKLMASVGENIRRQYELLQTAGVPSVLEWNEGNHFTEPDIRTAKGFSACMEMLRKGGAK